MASKKKSKTKKKVVLKKNKKTIEGFLTMEQLAAGTSVKATVKKVRRPKTKVVAKTPAIQEERPLYVRYYLEIISLTANEENLLEEITFVYKGVLIIPKSLKSVYKDNSYTTQCTFTIPKNIKDPILTKNFSNLTKKETHKFLIDNLSDRYISGIKKIIYKEVWPEHKIIDELPWK